MQGAVLIALMDSALEEDIGCEMGVEAEAEVEVEVEEAEVRRCSFLFFRAMCCASKARCTSCRTRLTDRTR